MDIQTIEKMTQMRLHGMKQAFETTPSVEVAKKMAQLLDITVGYLLGEVAQADTFKNPILIKRLQELLALPAMPKVGKPVGRYVPE